jgi:hypothetical protein
VTTVENSATQQGDPSTRRRLRQRRPVSSTEVTIPPKKLIDNRSNPSLPDTAISEARLKTPTKPRPGPEAPVTKARRKTPKKSRANADENVNKTQDRRKTPTRPRASIDDKVYEGNTTPTRRRPPLASGVTPVRRRTPRKTRNVGTNQAPLPREAKTPTRSRSSVDKKSDSTGKIRTTNARSDAKPVFSQRGSPKTPTMPRKKKVNTENGVKESSSSTGGAINGKIQSDRERLPHTPTKTKKRIIKETGTRSFPSTKLCAQAPEMPRVESSSTPPKPQGRNYSTTLSERRPQVSPDTERMDVNVAGPASTSPDSVLPSTMKDTLETMESPVEGSRNEGTGRNSTPTRIRKFLGATAERIVAACRTPPRSRNTISLSETTQEESDMDLSPLRRYGRLYTRSSPQEQKPSESQNAGRAAVSQSPPRQRITRKHSRSLSPFQRPSLMDNGIDETVTTQTPRPPSRGRQKNSSKMGKFNSDTLTRTKALSANPLSRESALPKTPKSGRRDLKSNASENAKNKTPTRSRRGGRIVSDSEAPAPSKREVSKPILRPRRKAGERASFSSASNSEKDQTEISIVSPMQQRKTPVRGRGRTPTKRRTQNSTLKRAVGPERVAAPDPPGSTKGKKRSVSLNNSRRARSQTRSHSPTAIPTESLHYRNGKLSLAQVPIL